MEKMTYQAVLEHFGGQSALASALGVSRQAISAWGGKIPKLRQYQIAQITGRRFRVE